MKQNPVSIEQAVAVGELVQLANLLVTSKLESVRDIATMCVWRARRILSGKTDVYSTTPSMIKMLKALPDPPEK